jgi:ribonuclease P protein component
VRLPTLTRRSEFDQAFEHGDSSRSNGLRLFARDNGLEHNRFGFVITTRVGNAVTRNRVRRWARELFRTWSARLRPGHDLVLLVHRQQASESYDDFRHHLRRACTSLRLAEGLNG